MKQTSLNGGSLSLKRDVTIMHLCQSELQGGEKALFNIRSNGETLNIQKTNRRR